MKRPATLAARFGLACACCVPHPPPPDGPARFTSFGAPAESTVPPPTEPLERDRPPGAAVPRDPDATAVPDARPEAGGPLHDNSMPPPPGEAERPPACRGTWVVTPERAPCLDDEERSRLHTVAPALLEAANRFDLPPDLLIALALVESRFDRRARGPAGAQGLLQLMPRTGRAQARALGLRYRPYDAATNALCGARYLRRALDRFATMRLALVAYNRGPGVAAKAAAGRPPPRAEAYVRRVWNARSCIAPALACIGDREARGPAAVVGP